MFKNIIGCLDEFTKTINGENAKNGWFNEEEEDIVDYFELHLAKALMKERYIDAEKVAKFILVAKGLSNEVKIK